MDHYLLLCRAGLYNHFMQYFANACKSDSGDCGSRNPQVWDGICMHFHLSDKENKARVGP